MFDPFVRYDEWGRPVYNRNSTPPILNLPTELGYSWGQGGGDTQTIQSGGGGGLLNTLGTVKNVAGLGKDAYQLFSGDNLFDFGSVFGGGSGAATPVAPEFGNLVFTDPGSLTGFEGAFGVGTDAGGSLAGFEGGFGMGVDPLAGFEAGFGVGGWGGAPVATGPGGLLPGGGVTSVGGEGAAAAAGGMGPLGYGAAGMGAMMALIALGGGFDPDTARIGLADSIKINPDGTLSLPNWTDTSNYGAQAPDAYYGVVNDIYDTLNRQIASGKIDPSWFQPGAGIDIGYGSDADVGLDNPQAYIRFITGNTSPGGDHENPWGNYPVDIGWIGSYEDLLSQLQSNPLPLLSAAPTFESTPLGQIYTALRQPSNQGDVVPDWWALRMAMDNAGSRE